MEDGEGRRTEGGKREREREGRRGQILNQKVSEVVTH